MAVLTISRMFGTGAEALGELISKRLGYTFYHNELIQMVANKAKVSTDWVEAMAFAWLARQTLLQQPGNLPSVTNAQKLTILGAVYFSNGIC